MNIKELIRKSYEDLLSLKVNWFNGLMLVLIVFILSGIVTPFIECRRLYLVVVIF